ncbi:Basic leucine zipper like [Quillaja saponaria]|uniref:Basic leucine zipper like n=1 Tax=Quillaja saponaria TaxID=32244 RepID=A0AAD7Q4N1_QUISA|nr:Basic leucine zipper like [Quillaja saponaria]
MSRQAHLPPRCPNQKKPITGLNHDSFSPSSCINILYPHHKKSPSHSSILEEQPAWLDELLNDPGSDSKGIFHRRSASDPLTRLDTIKKDFSSPPAHNNEEISVQNETCSTLQSACTYGPNSPRRRGTLIWSENSKASALLEYVSQDPPQYADDTLSFSETTQSNTKANGCLAFWELNAETNAVPVKRHSGQRSRVRKLQYIAELERTVDALQGLGSELAVRVGSLMQQRVALSMENSKLKQQLARLKQQKIILEDNGGIAM